MTRTALVRKGHRRNILTTHRREGIRTRRQKGYVDPQVVRFSERLRAARGSMKRPVWMG